MTINLLWMILAFGIGLGTGPSSPTVQYEWKQETHCYINGVWYNPCPNSPEPPPPGDPSVLYQ